MPVIYVLMAQMDHDSGSPIYASLDLDDCMRHDTGYSKEWTDELEIYAIGDDSAPRYYKRLTHSDRLPRGLLGKWRYDSAISETTRHWIEVEVPPAPLESREERLIRWAEQLMNEARS